MRPDGDAATRRLAAHLNGARSHDVLLLAGDLGVSDETIAECLALFRHFPGHKLAIPGNHDVWVPHDAAIDSRERHAGLPQLFRDAGFHPLEEGPLTIDGVGFAGCMGWYDYTFRDPSLGYPDDCYVSKCEPGGTEPVWGDAGHVRWPWSDVEVTAREVARLDAHLQQLTGAREVIVVTHHLLTSRLLFHPRVLVPKFWRFANAFLGSERMGEVIARYPNVRLAICGHIHEAREVTIGTQRFASVGGDYSRKALCSYDGKDIKRQWFTE
jgi:3',5'-cyclic AMP phosphodiesterase CpdA